MDRRAREALKRSLHGLKRSILMPGKESELSEKMELAAVLRAVIKTWQ